MQGKSRSAVIFYGLVHRSIKLTYRELNKFMLEPLQQLGPVDVYYHTWHPERLENPRADEYTHMLNLDDLKLLPQGAKGLIESQSHFDQSVNWLPFFKYNIMRDCTETEGEAQRTLMNFFRAVVSLERAWAYFVQHKTDVYERIIVTRADLRFLFPLQIPYQLDCLWIPDFHSWEGINDRFCMGPESKMAVYCQRVDFTSQWLQSSAQGTAEGILHDWLQRKNIAYTRFDYPFVRVRANGTLPEFDQKIIKNCIEKGLLPPIPSPQKMSNPIKVVDTHSKAGKHRFLILARDANPRALNLLRVLDPLGEVELILDTPNQGGLGIYYPDELLAGYRKLMGHSYFNDLTAWSRALYHAEQTLSEEPYFWFVEDDVAGTTDEFRQLIAVTEPLAPDLAALEISPQLLAKEWYWWPLALDWFETNYKSFNPLCCLSARLLKAIFALRQAKGRFIFHEILFPSVAVQQGLNVLDWRNLQAYSKIFGHFYWRSEVLEPQSGICHPVKTDRVHQAMSKLEKTHRISQKKMVFVLGMHRSGTSAMAAGLEALGLSIGKHKETEVNPENPKGFFENRDIIHFNERLLTYLGGSWENTAFNGPQTLSRLNQTALQDWYREAYLILENNFAEADWCCIKDPRICILLPFWLNVSYQWGISKTNLYTIHMVRNPLEVAASQQRRHQTNPKHYPLGAEFEETLALWKTYIFQGLSSLRGEQNLSVLYENLLAHPQDTLQRIAEFLQVEPDPMKTNAYIETFLDPELRHHRYTHTDLNEIDSHALDLYKILETWAQQPRFGQNDIQKFLANSEQMTSLGFKPPKDKLAIYQIYFQPEQRRLLESAFIPYDNADCPVPEQREYWVFLENYRKGIMNRAEYTGFISWKFREKTQISGDTFVDFILANPGYDVYFINPFPRNLFWKNVWVQGESCHPGLIELTQKIFNRLGYDFDIAASENLADTAAYCNYWVGNQKFWKKYMDFTLPIYHHLLYELTPEEEAFVWQRASKDIDAPFLPFMFERLLSTFLLMDDTISHLVYRYSEAELKHRYSQKSAQASWWYWPGIEEMVLGCYHYEQRQYGKSSAQLLKALKHLFYDSERIHIRQEVERKLDFLSQEFGALKGKYEQLNQAYVQLHKKHLELKQTNQILIQKSAYLLEQNEALSKEKTESDEPL